MLLALSGACLADQLIRCARSARQTARQTRQSMRIQIEESRTPVDYSCPVRVPVAIDLLLILLILDLVDL